MLAVFAVVTTIGVCKTPLDTTTAPVPLGAGPAGPCIPGSPVSPFMPWGPATPASPFGIVKLKTAADVVPEFETDAEVPATPVVVVPTATVQAGP